MKNTCPVLLLILVLCALLCIVPVTGLNPVLTEEPFNPVTESPTPVPTTESIHVGGGKGWVDVYANIDGATVYFDGVPQGSIAGGILSVAVTPTATPVRTVRVSKSGYTAWSGQLSRMPSSSEHVQVYATLNPVPTQTPVPPERSGTIYAHSSPAGAKISMNGNTFGYSPVTIPDLAPGTYSMKATLSGYTTDTRLVTVYAGQTASYYPVLQPSPTPPRDTGTVSVTSSPDHALVFVDGNYQGKAPLTVTLFPGSHSFRLSLSGYNDYTTTVYVNGGTAQNLNTIMTPAVYGSVSIISMPGATVYLDSNSQGTIPPSGTLTLNNIANGNHLFKLTYPGYNDWINTIYVIPNTLVPVTAVMTTAGPNPTPVPATGGFSVVSTPSGAEFFVDNLFRGYTPATIDGISPGQHVVMLKYTGYLDSTTTTSVSSGQTTPLALSLQPVPTPTPESAPSPVIIIGALVAISAISGILRRRS
ncbi:MAG: PEGA domain-containing protein [Methanoregula sp.]|jgi:hypothetical protein|nr:PEGA domain-containing protein [Methanoregula sp.]